MSNIIDSIQLSGTVYTISGGSGGNYSAGRGIDITNDIISLDLPISAGTGSESIKTGYSGNTASGIRSIAEGEDTTASGYASHAEGIKNVAGGSSSHAEGQYTETKNWGEHACGTANVSNSGSTDADKTLFSVGNGANPNNRHNAFEIRRNADIYIVSGGTDIKLQDHLGGGGNATVELTQAEYDALVSAGTVASDTYYIITDALGANITSAVTSGSTSVVTSGGVYNQLGGLKLIKMTSQEYASISGSADSNTVYIIKD